MMNIFIVFLMLIIYSSVPLQYTYTLHWISPRTFSHTFLVRFINLISVLVPHSCTVCIVFLRTVRFKNDIFFIFSIYLKNLSLILKEMYLFIFLIIHWTVHICFIEYNIFWTHKSIYYFYVWVNTFFLPLLILNWINSLFSVKISW